jgi:hypothetical protein
MLVAQYSETGRRYAFVLVNCWHFKGKIELIISFEVSSVLLKYNLATCLCAADFGWRNMGQLQVSAGVRRPNTSVVTV